MARSTLLYPVAVLASAAVVLAPSAFSSASSGVGFVAGQETGASPATGPVSLIRIEEPITPTSNDYIRRAIERANQLGSPALVMELDTPGGLLESTREIVMALFGSPVPVIVYVTPGGARAASAGTFITLAGHVAAMAPSTTIGAASPVSMGGAQMDTVSQSKAFNYAETFMQTVAERRGRNVEWAVSAVREADAITGEEALEAGAIDLVAGSVDELLRRVDGMEVEVGGAPRIPSAEEFGAASEGGAGAVEGGEPVAPREAASSTGSRTVTLRTAGAAVQTIPKNLAERFLGLIIRPELMLILTLVAMYGIIGEMTNPGAIVPGVAGAIALILLLYASAAMPVNLAGYALLVLAAALFIAEAFTPAFGLLIAAGSVAFFLGGLMLFQELPESLELSLAWLLPATVMTTLFFVFIVTAGLKAQLVPTRTGLEAMVGGSAEVVDPVSRSGGRVFVAGEYWNAVSDDPEDRPIEEGRRVTVESVEGLTMKVRSSS